MEGCAINDMTNYSIGELERAFDFGSITDGDEVVVNGHMTTIYNESLTGEFIPFSSVIYNTDSMDGDRVIRILVDHLGFADGLLEGGLAPLVGGSILFDYNVDITGIIFRSPSEEYNYVIRSIKHLYAQDKEYGYSFEYEF